MTIPIGTICIIRRTVYQHLLGTTCETVSVPPVLAEIARSFDDYVMCCDGLCRFAVRGEIIPIAPPGDPDIVTTPEREPMEVLR